MDILFSVGHKPGSRITGSQALYQGSDLSKLENWKSANGVEMCKNKG